MSQLTTDEFMSVLCAREIRPTDRVCVGVSAEIASAGALLASELHAPQARYQISGLGENYFHGDEGAMLCHSGKVDVFFFSAVQIDAFGNINMQYLGDPMKPKKRFFGAFAAPLLYYTVRRPIVFRNEHSPRVFVPQVDFVTAAARNFERRRRPGHLSKVVTPIAVLAFNQDRGLLELESYHPGQSIESVQNATGFELPLAANIRETAMPTAQEVDLMQNVVRARMIEMFGASSAAA